MSGGLGLGEIVRTAAGEVRHHKLRSTLTLLGIVLGTLSITVMTSLLDGVVQTVWDGMDKLGLDGVVFVVPREAKNLREAEMLARSKGLQPADAAILRARARAVQAVAPIQYGDGVVRRGPVERRVQVLGITEDYARVRNRHAARGRYVGPADERAYARVAVLGSRLAKRLFGSDDPLGKAVTVDGRTFAVIGVGEALDNQFVHDGDALEEMEGLALPLATIRKLVSGEEDPVSVIAVRTGDPARLGELVSEIEAGLTLAHRGAQDFKVENVAQEIVKARRDVAVQLRNWRIVLGTIAGISLAVGGIGLLSVMLIAIGERLYEIGLRKALGATNGQVFVQFLAESVFLALLGGVIGAGAGAGITMAAGRFFKSGLPVNVGGLALAIGIAFALGVVYGAYPALVASRLAPVDALRSAA